MNIDLNTAYIIIFLITITITGTNWYLTRFFLPPKYLFSWNISMTVWLMTLIMVLIQGRFIILGQILASLLTAVYMVWFYRPLIHLSNRTSPGPLREVMFCLAYSLMAFLEIWYLQLNLLRPVIHNSLMVYVCLLYFSDTWFNRAPALAAISRSVRLFFSLSFLLFGLAYFLRLLTALPALQAQTLYDVSVYTVFSVLIGPPFVFLANASMIMTGIVHQFTRKEETGQRYIRHESDALHQHVLAKLNHELNTPLGNIRLALDMHDEGPLENRQEAASIIRTGFQQLAGILADQPNTFDQPLAGSTERVSVQGFTNQLNTILSRGFMANRVQYSCTNDLSEELEPWDLYLICVSFAELIQSLALQDSILLTIRIWLKESRVYGSITPGNTLVLNPNSPNSLTSSHQLWFTYILESRSQGKIETFNLGNPIECQFSFAGNSRNSGGSG